MEGGGSMTTETRELGDELLSEEISKQVNEAKRLLELKAELGRLPKSARVDYLVKTIAAWFDSVSPIAKKGPKVQPDAELEALDRILISRDAKDDYLRIRSRIREKLESG
jgi:hypothetical protein